jgi:hypothetical protein
MKKLLLLAAITCILFTNCSNLFSQYNWHAPQKLTNGFVDKNPSFNPFWDHSNYYTYGWELFVFERQSLPNAQICALKLGATSPLDSVMTLTSNASLKRNPSIAYGRNYYNYYDYNIASALVLWETNQNGKWDIYGRYYTRLAGWGTVFPFDTASGNKYSPHSYFIDSITYAVSYTRNGDVILRKFNPLNRTILYDTNLTVSDTSFCSNANLWNYTSSVSQSFYIVTYEKKKPDNKRAIYYRKSSALPVWSQPDTVAYAGDNTFNSFCYTYSNMAEGIAFESNRSGFYNIYATSVPLTTGTSAQETIYTNNPGYNYSNFVNMYYGIITDYISFVSCAFVRKGRDSLKIIFDERAQYPIYKDSVTIGDTSKSTRITINNGITNSYQLYGWIVYTKDSAAYSNLWARYRIIPLGDIKRIGNSVPEKFSLSQNYPNPFNPVTKIRFDIPEYGKWNNGNDIITLKIYDLLGKEIAVLVNEKFAPGVYEATFDASKYSSGVYFYRLALNNEQLAIKKMVLIK